MTVLYSYPKGADKTFTFNNTDGLQAVTIEIEKIIRWVYEYYNEPFYIPPIDKMVNYGLPKEQQVWKRPEEPERLKILLKRARQEVRRGRTSDTLPEQIVIIYIRKHLIEHAKEYQSEIQWIRDMWYYRLFGMWILINNKPTWIPSFHFSYLFSYDLGGDGYPLYRDIDRRVYLIDTYAFLARETFEKLDNDGFAIPEEDGSYLMKPTKDRAIGGTQHPKSRREGSTQKYMSMLLDIMTLTIGADYIAAIQSFGGTSSSQMYEGKLLPAFKKKPFYFKPIWSGSNAPKDKLVFSANSSDMVETELECSIIPATTVDRATFDGLKAKFIHEDESAKITDHNILTGHGLLKPTIKNGDAFHGFMSYPSTTEEFSGENADKYEQLFHQSNFYKRDKLNGQTQSGLIAYFMDAAEFYTDGFLDRYGFTVIGKPTKEQAEFIGKNYGSSEALESQADQILKSDSLDKEKDYRDFRRRYPRTIKDVFLSTAGDIGFNLTKLDNRNTELKEHERTDPVVRIGSYRWKNNIIDGEVEFYDDPNGFWELSDEPPAHIKNKKFTKMDFDPVKNQRLPTYAPAMPGYFISSSDTYRFSNKSKQQLEKDKSKMSLGGGATFMDKTDADKDGRVIEEFEGYKFTATFLGRYVDEKVYCEQMLMNSVYWSAFQYPEANIPTIENYFIERGYRGFLLYDYDTRAKGFKTYAGFNSTEGKKNELFKALNFFIEFAVHRCKHRRLIEQCIQIRAMSEMRKYDLIPPCGGCLVGLQNESWTMIKRLNVQKIFKASDYY